MKRVLQRMKYFASAVEQIDKQNEINISIRKRRFLTFVFLLL